MSAHPEDPALSAKQVSFGRFRTGSFDEYLAMAACLLTVSGAKNWLIRAQGSATPFWDQWDGEAALLFKPFLDGRLPWSQFLAQHNEHRILFPRIFALGLLWLNQFWDPLLEMAVYGFLHVLAIGVLLALTSAAVDKSRFLIFCLFAAIFCAIPFGWENTLTGFSSHFYLLMLFSFVSLRLLHKSAAWGPAWWLGIFCGIAAYFSMASGTMTIAAGICLALAQMLAGRRGGPQEIFALGFQAVILLTMLFDTPVLPAHAPLKAQSFLQFLKAFSWAASWPVAAAPAVMVVAMYAPVLLVIGLTMRAPPPKEDHRWFVVSVGFWVGLQMVALAYGRAGGVLAPRYLDILVVGVLINFLSLLIALSGQPPAFTLRVGAAAWLLLVFVGAGEKAMSKVPDQIAEKRRTSLAQSENLSRYLATGDLNFLEGKPPFEIPYPSAQRLSEIVSMPEIRAILPPILLGQSEPAVDSHGTALRRLAAASTREFKTWSLRVGPIMLPLGLALFLVIATLSSAVHNPREPK